jgi:hypothetical protein
MGNNYLLTKVQSQLFDGIIIVTWVLYIIIVLGLSASAPDYLDDLQYYVKIYISLFLIWRFNPFRQVKFTYLDAKIAFNAGIFLIMTTFIGSFIKKYTSEIQTIMKKI